MRVWRLTVSDSVEDKLLHLQERKRQLAHAALETNHLDAGGGGDDNEAGGDSGRVGDDDGAAAGGAESGVKKQEQQQQRLTVDELTDFFR